MRTCQCHLLISPREDGTKSHGHVCSSPFVTAPAWLPLPLAVIENEIGHFHSARASSRLTSHGCASCKETKKTACSHRVFYAPLGLISTRFPMLLVSGYDQAAAVDLFAPDAPPKRLAKRPHTVLQMQALTRLLLLDHTAS